MQDSTRPKGHGVAHLKGGYRFVERVSNVRQDEAPRKHSQYKTTQVEPRLRGTLCLVNAFVAPDLSWKLARRTALDADMKAMPPELVALDGWGREDTSRGECRNTAYPGTGRDWGSLVASCRRNCGVQEAIRQDRKVMVECDCDTQQ